MGMAEFFAKFYGSMPDGGPADGWLAQLFAWGKAISVYAANHLPLKYPEVIFLAIPLFFILLYIVRKNVVKFSSKEEKREYLQQNGTLRFFIFWMRFLIFSLLLIAIASPYVIKEKEVQGDLSITLLADHSSSMSLFERGIDEKLQEQLESNIPTKVVEIAEGDVSGLGDAILSNLEKDASVLIISDGNNNAGRDLGDILVLASQLNSTINMVELEPLYADTAVRIEGPSTSISGSDITFTAAAEQAGEKQQYTLTVEIDGNEVVSEAGSGAKSVDVTKQLSEGYHQVTASVAIDDYFTQNNVFHKSIQIIPKPHLAFVSLQSSPILGQLSNIYMIDVLDHVPEEPAGYSAIILNDIPSSMLPSGDISKLTDAVVDGRGLLVIGGKQSYDLGDYAGSLFETLLPARSGEGEKTPDKKVAIVIVIDISGSTGGSVSGLGDASKVDMEKSLAVKIIQDDIRPEDRVGIVAFNSQSFIISPLSRLEDKQDDVIGLISSLQDGGGTDVKEGIKEAEQMLRGIDGSKNIILISDGITKDSDDALARIGMAQYGGIKTYAIGVGDNTKAEFMIRAAQLGGGIFFQPDSSQHLKLLFGEPDDDDKNKKDLIVLDEHHFITHDLNLTGALAGYNQVVPKASADNLVMTGNGNPVLVTWRFGLGRVATMATDDGTAWGGALLSSDNSKLYTRIINWIIGDPGKDKSRTVMADDGFVGEPLEVLVRSSSPPSSSAMEFSKIDDELYRGVMTPASAGFLQILDATIAVNAKKEYLHTGMNKQLAALVRMTGGEVFGKDDINGILEKAKSSAKRKETREIPFDWPFLAAALGLFVIDIFVRKLAEHRRK